jgi:hypothetical protein
MAAKGVTVNVHHIRETARSGFPGSMTSSRERDLHRQQNQRPTGDKDRDQRHAEDRHMDCDDVGHRLAGVAEDAAALADAAYEVKSSSAITRAADSRATSAPRAPMGDADVGGASGPAHATQIMQFCEARTDRQEVTDSRPDRRVGACSLEPAPPECDRPGAGGGGFVLVAAPARRRARCGVVTGKSFRRGAGLTR